MSCGAPQTVYAFRGNIDPSKLSFNQPAQTASFHFFPLHDATTAGDQSQINNVNQRVGPIVVTILIVVGVSVLVTSLAAFLILSARRRRRMANRLASRMANAEKGGAGFGDSTDVAARFQPQYSRKGSSGTFWSILNKLKLADKTPPEMTHVSQKVIITRWDAHARDPSDSIVCTKHERDGTSSYGSPLGPPSGGLSSMQNRRISGRSSETQIRRQISVGGLSDKYTRPAPKRPKRPSKALFSTVLSSTDVWPEQLREKLKGEMQRRGNKDGGVLRPPGLSKSSGALIISTPIPAPTLDFSRLRLGAETSPSFNTPTATIPEFVMPDDSSSRAHGTERSFVTRSPGKPI